MTCPMFWMQVFAVAMMASLTVLLVLAVAWAGSGLFKDIIKELRNDK